MSPYQGQATSHATGVINERVNNVDYVEEIIKFKEKTMDWLNEYMPTAVM